MTAKPFEPPITHRSSAEVECLLDQAFAYGHMRPCVGCGAMIGTKEGVCYPCSTGNRARGPIYGASLAGHQAVGLAAPATCAECADLLTQNLALVDKVRALRGQLAEAQAAAVRSQKCGGMEGA